jgi:hypothetical protein
MSGADPVDTENPVRIENAGRPGLAAAIRDLIVQMGQANFLRGAPRIQGGGSLLRRPGGPS